MWQMPIYFPSQIDDVGLFSFAAASAKLSPEKMCVGYGPLRYARLPYCFRIEARRRDDLEEFLLYGLGGRGKSRGAAVVCCFSHKGCIDISTLVEYPAVKRHLFIPLFYIRAEN